MIFLIPACRHSNRAKDLTLNFWVGDYEAKGIRNRDNVLIPASDEEFNEFACLHRVEIKKLLRVLGGRRNFPLKGDINELLIELSDDPIAETIRQEREKLERKPESKLMEVEP